VDSAYEPGNRRDDPERDQFRGRGTAYITWWNEDEWRGYWDLSPHGDDGGRFLEDSGLHDTAASAIAWARKRTRRVVVTPRGKEPAWAGEGSPPEGLDVFEDDGS